MPQAPCFQRRGFDRPARNTLGSSSTPSRGASLGLERSSSACAVNLRRSCGLGFGMARWMTRVQTYETSTGVAALCTVTKLGPANTMLNGFGATPISLDQ